MLFYIIFIITIIILTYLFYIKFFKKIETFEYLSYPNDGYGYTSNTNIANELIGNYINNQKVVNFNTSNGKCVFLNTAPIQKEFKRFIVPREEANLTELADYDVENEIFKKISLTYNKYNYNKFDIYSNVVSKSGSAYSESFSFNNLIEVFDQISKTLLNNTLYKAASFYNNTSNTVTIYYHSTVSAEVSDKPRDIFITYHSIYNYYTKDIQNRRFTTHLYKELTPTTETKETTDSILYQNDKHIDINDPNLHTILDFNYEPELDKTGGELFVSTTTPIIDNTENTQEYTKTFDYNSIQKFNSQRVKSSYYKTYTICNNTLDMSSVNADESGIIYNDNTSATDALEKAFPCGVLVCGGNDASTDELTTEAYKKLNEKITSNNVNYIYDNILYSPKYLKWLYDLKDSHDTISELKSSN